MAKPTKKDTEIAPRIIPVTPPNAPFDPIAAPFTLSGVVKTSSGYAVVTAKYDSNCHIVELKQGPSQSQLPFIAEQHKRILPTLADEVHYALREPKDK